MTDKSIEQLVNAATLPGIVGYAIAMPDVHQGYGFPVGGVAVTRLPDGVISPGSIGYDINCGVRLLASDLYADEVEPHLDDLAAAPTTTAPAAWAKAVVIASTTARWTAFWRKARIGASSADSPRSTT